MKALLIGFVLFVSTVSFAKVREVSVCEKAAVTKATQFFARYVKNFEKNYRENLQPGDKFNPDDMPGGLELQQQEGSAFSFGWGERQECACGMEVETKESADKKSCSAEVVKKSVSCECG